MDWCYFKSSSHLEYEEQTRGRISSGGNSRRSSLYTEIVSQVIGWSGHIILLRPNSLDSTFLTAYLLRVVGQGMPKKRDEYSERRPIPASCV